jgi:hypothetical protein
MRTAAAFPNWWIRDKRLKLLGAGKATTGQSIAALKVYLAIALSADELFSEVQVPITQLGVLTGMSRPMVVAGIRGLEEIGALAVDRDGYRSTYRLVQDETRKQFSKLPRDIIRARLKNLPNGSAEALAALKIYVALLTVRQRNSHLAPVSHQRIQVYTGIRPGVISKGASILVEHGLVRHSNRAMFRNPDGYPVNNYYVVGVLGEHDQEMDLDPRNVDPAAGIPAEADHGPLEAEVKEEGAPTLGENLPEFTSEQLREIFSAFKVT